MSETSNRDRVNIITFLLVIYFMCALLSYFLGQRHGYQWGQADGLNNVWHYELIERREVVAIDD